MRTKAPGIYYNLLRRDSLLAWRNGHVAVTLALMVLMILLVSLLPEAIASPPRIILLDLSSGQAFAKALDGMEQLRLVQDQAGLDAALRERDGLVGLTIRGNLEHPQLELAIPSQLTARQIARLEASLDQLVRGVQGTAHPQLEVAYLSEPAPPVPLYLRGVPIFLIFEAGILGFLLVAVFVFQEKQEGTIRAYRVSPAGCLSYLSAKTSVFLALSMFYGGGVIVAAILRGARPDLAMLLLSLAGASASLSLLGLGFACYFDNLSQWFFPGLAVLLFNITPFLNHLNPGFDPFWLRLSPAWAYLQLNTTAILNPGGQVSPASLALAIVWLVATAIFAWLSVRGRLLREVL